MVHGIVVEYQAPVPALRRVVPAAIIIIPAALGLPYRAAAGQETTVAISERARGADRVVVAQVRSVRPQWQVNEFGDRLIVSVVSVAVEETLKGTAQQLLDLEVEGGTIGSLTLRVSDEESFAVGERAVLYLKRNVRGAFVPHLRGQGVLKLDASNRIRGSNLTLEDVRRSISGQTR